MPNDPTDRAGAASPGDHLPYVRRCYELAAEAVAGGNHPFGAVLVLDGRVVSEAGNAAITSGDPTRHAEMRAHEAGLPGVAPADRARLVLYTSTEPCVMCTGAIYWAEIGAVVFGCSARALGEAAGDDFLVPAGRILALGRRPPRLVGPLLEEEGRARHRAYWPPPAGAQAAAVEFVDLLVLALGASVPDDLRAFADRHRRPAA